MARTVPFNTEYAIERHDGQRRWIACRGEVTTHEPGQPTVHGICQDLTDRQELVDRLREADKLKDQFLGVVSHELRTPLTSILGFSHLLEGAADDDDTSAWTEVIVRNAEEMHGMVERILDYSRVHSGAMKIDIGTHRATDLIDEVLALVVSPLRQHVLETDVDPTIVVAVDRSALHRVLVNLLTNSAKFSPPGTSIRIEFGPSTAAGKARLQVVDHGCGIPSAELRTVFERFHQVASDQIATRRGVGVGLAIVKEYVEAMSGSVWAERAPDGGTVITVDLPLAP